LCHVYDYENVEKVLGPAKEIRDQSLMPRSW